MKPATQKNEIPSGVYSVRFEEIEACRILFTIVSGEFNGKKLTKKLKPKS